MGIRSVGRTSFVVVMPKGKKEKKGGRNHGGMSRDTASEFGESVNSISKYLLFLADDLIYMIVYAAPGNARELRGSGGADFRIDSLPLRRN